MLRVINRMYRKAVLKSSGVSKVKIEMVEAMNKVIKPSCGK
jgi:hypothetical protein